MSLAALLRHPPFRMKPDMDPGAAARAMVAAFDVLAATPAPLAHAYGLAMQVTDLAPAHPLYRAGMAAARDIDAGIGAGVPHGYHDARHFCEVLLCALAIAQLACLTQQEQGLLLLAALLHDFHHDGGKRLYPFHHELCSLAAASSYLDAAGVAVADRAVLATLILATESVCGVPLARCCHAWHSGAMTPPPPPLRPELAILAARPRLALMAAALTEADVLPSVALTPGHAALMTAKLEAEWNIVLGTAGKIEFIDRYVGALQVAHFFQPNLYTVRQASLA
jgi:hypothetical protein